MNFHLIYPIPVEHSDDIYLIATDLKSITISKRMTISEINNWMINKTLVLVNQADAVIKHTAFRYLPVLPLLNYSNQPNDPSLETIKQNLLAVGQHKSSSVEINTSENSPVKQQTVLLFILMKDRSIIVDHTRRVLQVNADVLKTVAGYRCYILGIKEHIPMELKSKYLELPQNINPLNFFCYFTAPVLPLVKNLVSLGDSIVRDRVEIPTWAFLKIFKIASEYGMSGLENDEILDMFDLNVSNDAVIIRKNDSFSNLPKPPVSPPKNPMKEELKESKSLDELFGNVVTISNPLKETKLINLSDTSRKDPNKAPVFDWYAYEPQHRVRGLITWAQQFTNWSTKTILFQIPDFNKSNRAYSDELFWVETRYKLDKFLTLYPEFKEAFRYMAPEEIFYFFEKREFPELNMTNVEPQISNKVETKPVIAVKPEVKKTAIDLAKEFLKTPKFNSQIREYVSKGLNVNLTNSDINKLLYNNPAIFKKNVDGSWENVA